jgi:benzodiazapine receptor
MQWADLKKLVFLLVVCEAAGLFGSIFNIPSIPTWYASLNKPWFTPPSWLFAPVWIMLYALMAVSLFLVWRRGLLSDRENIAVCVFALQLVLNAAWSLIFFGLRMPLAALAEIMVLWFSIALTIALFWKISRKAAILLLPYLAWVSFAVALNYFFWALN